MWTLIRIFTWQAPFYDAVRNSEYCCNHFIWNFVNVLVCTWRHCRKPEIICNNKIRFLLAAVFFPVILTTVTRIPLGCDTIEGTLLHTLTPTCASVHSYQSFDDWLSATVRTIGILRNCAVRTGYTYCVVRYRYIWCSRVNMFHLPCSDGTWAENETLPCMTLWQIMC